MKKLGKIHSNQALENGVHFFVPSSLNDAPRIHFQRIRARRKRVSIRNLSFKQLEEIMRDRAGQVGMPSQASLGNLISALRSFLRDQGIEPTEPVGSVLRVSFYKNLSNHIAKLNAEGRTASYVANRKSALGAWRKLVSLLDQEDAAVHGSETPFQSVLRSLFASGVKVKATAKATGIPLATLRRWLAGATPRRGCESKVRRLERFFAMTPGTLTDLLPYRDSKNESSGSETRIAYRERLRRVVSDPYALKAHSATRSFVNEWQALLHFKTDLFSIADHSSGNVATGRTWRLGPRDSAPDAKDWISSVAGRICKTARIRFSTVAQYIGWLQLDPSKGGLGLPPEEAQTLSNFTNTEYLAKYLAWRTRRNDGIVSATVELVTNFVAALCHPRLGFLVYHPEFGARVGITNTAEWRERCERAWKYAKSIKKKLAQLVRKSRDPFEPIAAILKMENPLNAVADALRRLDADRPATGGLKEAIWARDRLLLALSASNPLRALNLKRLTYRADNSGHLRQDANGAWRIVIPKEQLKNERGAARDRDYDQPVQEQLWPFIERYLRDYWRMLAAPGNDRVFVSACSPDREWEGLNRRFEILTKKYFTACQGTGPHAMRHIVATALIKRTGSFAAAALVLHDREDTVRAHYGHLCGEDGSRWLSEVLNDAFGSLNAS